MDDAHHDAEPEESPYIRLPWGLVAAGLGGLLLLALGLGLYANRYLRPQVQVMPTPLAVAAATSAPPPTFTPTANLAPAPTSLVVATAAAPTVAAAATLPATTPPATTPPATTPPAASPTTVATPRPTVSPELANEIGDAYQTYWQVRAEALYDLDSSRLPTVMAGEHLAAVEDRINELRAEGHAIETDIDHNYAIFEASDEDAKVVDTYADHSVYIDAQTHEHLTTPTGEKLNEVYIMDKTDGIWRVIDLVRSP
jgi:hypothetical protein